MESTMEQDEMRMERKDEREERGKREEKRKRRKERGKQRLRQIDAQKGNIEGDVDIQYLGLALKKAPIT